MLNYETASTLYHTISTKASANDNPDFQAFYTKFLDAAVAYVSIRTRWHFMEPAQRAEHDQARSREHDGYMARLSAVCRNLGIEDVDTILPDRKMKGDFACYVALFLAMEQR